MKKLRIVSMLLVLTLLMTACGAFAAVPKSADYLDMEEESVLKGTAETDGSRWDYEITTYTVTGEHCARDDSGRVLIRHSYQIPRMKVSVPEDDRRDQSKADAKAAADAFNSFFEEKLKDEVEWFEEMAAVAEEDYKTAGHQEDSLWQQEDFCYSDETGLEFWTGGILLCVTTVNSSFTGGAHPNVWRSTANFDLRTGREIAMKDLTGDVDRLQQTVEQELLRQVETLRALPDEESAEGKVHFFEDYAETLGNWMERSVAFCDEGMQVIFGVYDIAPYAAGEQVFTIPYEMLTPCLNRYGKTLLGLN